MNTKFKEAGWAVNGAVFVFTHGSDECPLSQSAMLCHRMPGETNPTCRHIFGKFNADGRMVEDAAALIDSMLPSEDLSLEAKEDSYKFIWSVIASNAKEMLLPNAKAWCFRHLQCCNIAEPICATHQQHPTSWRHHLTDVMGQEHFGCESLLELDESDRLHQEAVAELETLRATAEAEDKDKEELEVVEAMPSWKELTVNVAGTSCTDWCGYSAREGAAGKTMVPFMHWCLDTIVVRPIIWFAEISGAEETLYLEKLGHIYDVFSVQNSPLHEGVPEHRDRLYTCGCDKFRSAFTGAADEYHMLTERRCEMTAHDFLVVDQNTRWKHARELAEKQGHCHQCEDNPIPLQHQMTPLMYTRYLEHVQKAQRNFGSAKGTVADADQNVSHSSPALHFRP